MGLLAGYYDSRMCTRDNVRRQSKCQRDSQHISLNFSVGIPHFNRGDKIFRPLCNLLSHPAVSEVIIVDDGSSQTEFDALQNSVAQFNTKGLVQIHRRASNLGALQTKLECVERASSQWVLILDSDNTAFVNYLDALSKINDPQENTFYCSGWAFPYFPFHPLHGLKMDFSNACKLTLSGDLRRYYIINDGNYLVHRDSYLRSVGGIGPIRSDVADVMVVNYHWLSKGGRLAILPGTSYFHRVDATSFWCRTEAESRRRVADIFARFEKHQKWDDDFARSLDSE